MKLKRCSCHFFTGGPFDFWFEYTHVVPKDLYAPLESLLRFVIVEFQSTFLLEIMISG